MRKQIFFTILFLSLGFNAFADFKPVEKEVVKLRKTLSKNKVVNKKDLAKSLMVIESKAKLIVNDFARTDITNDVGLIYNKYVTKNEGPTAESKKVDYWLEHIVEDLEEFRSHGITE